MKSTKVKTFIPIINDFLLKKFSYLNPRFVVQWQARSSWNESAHNYVFFQSFEVINGSCNARIGENFSGFLKRGRGNKAIGTQRGLGNPEDQGFGHRRLAAFFNDNAIGLFESDLVDLLFLDKIRIAHIQHLHPPHHLTNDHLYVLVVYTHTLQPVDLLDLIN